MAAANVVCQQLGYGGASYYGTNFTSGSKAPFLTDIECTGNEDAITKCRYKVNAMNVIGNCNPDQYVGVNCNTGIIDNLFKLVLKVKNYTSSCISFILYLAMILNKFSRIIHT